MGDARGHRAPRGGGRRLSGRPGTGGVRPPDGGSAAEGIMDQTHNLLADVPAELPEELIQTLVAAPGVRIERIVSHGHASPPGFWYDQGPAEWVLVVAGAPRLRFEGGDAVEMTPGAYVNIPAGRRHRVEWTDPDRPT